MSFDGKCGVVSQWNLLSSMWGAHCCIYRAGVHSVQNCSGDLLLLLRKEQGWFYSVNYCDFQADLSIFLFFFIKMNVRLVLKFILEVTRYVWDRRLMQVWNKWFLTQRNRKRPLVQRAIISILDSPGSKKKGFPLLFWTGTGAPSQLTYFFQRRSHLPGTVVDICGWKLYTGSDNVRLYL